MAMRAIKPFILVFVAILSAAPRAEAAAPPIQGNPGVPGLTAHIVVLTAMITSMEAQIAALQQQVSSNDALVAALNGQIAALNAQLAAANTAARVPKTGQTTCWDTGGAPIPCAGTGQDGDIQAGVALPSPRFTDNQDGTIKDNLTGLIILREAHCFGGQTWDGALSQVKSLASGACGLSDGSVAGEWRLPNVRELFSLVDHTELPLSLVPNHPFVNAQIGYYWSSTTFSADRTQAWRVNFAGTDINSYYKSSPVYLVIAVRGGT